MRFEIKLDGEVVAMAKYPENACETAWQVGEQLRAEGTYAPSRVVVARPRRK